MRAFSGYDTAKVRKGGVFDPLPKGAYPLKVINVIEAGNKNGGSRFDIWFDVAEGEYISFYQLQWADKKAAAKEGEEVKYPNDAIYRLNIPEDDSAGWMKDNFKTFVASLEDSNPGYHWDWDERKWKGLLFGGVFHVEQSEYEGNIYDHTRLAWVIPADDARDYKGQYPKDKLINSGSGSGTGAPDDGFVNVPAGIDTELPFA